MRKSIVAAVLAAALVVPVVVRAHGGHVHKVMGTVTAVSPTKIEVKTTDGKTETVLLDKKTVYEEGKTKVDLAALKTGVRVVVEGTQPDGSKTLTAQTVRIGVVADAAAAKK